MRLPDLGQYCQSGCCPDRPNFQAGEILYSPGDFCEQIYFVHSGKVKLSYLDESGRRLTLALLGEGEVFGELSVLDGQESAALLAEVIEDSCICLPNHIQFKRALAQNPELANWLLAIMAQHQQRYMEKLLRLHFNDVPQRVARELLFQAERCGEKARDGIAVALTHQELADLIGSTRETTTFALHRFMRDDILVNKHGHSRGRIFIADLVGLREVAKGKRRIAQHSSKDRICAN